MSFTVTTVYVIVCYIEITEIEMFLIFIVLIINLIAKLRSPKSEMIFMILLTEDFDIYLSHISIEFIYRFTHL